MAHPGPANPQLIPAIPEAFLGDVPEDRFEVQHHRGVVVGQPVQVAVGVPECLRHPDRSVAPHRRRSHFREREPVREVGVLEHVGHHEWDGLGRRVPRLLEKVP